MSPTPKHEQARAMSNGRGIMYLAARAVEQADNPAIKVGVWVVQAAGGMLLLWIVMGAKHMLDAQISQTPTIIDIRNAIASSVSDRSSLRQAITATTALAQDDHQKVTEISDFLKKDFEAMTALQLSVTKLGDQVQSQHEDVDYVRQQVDRIKERLPIRAHQ